MDSLDDDWLLRIIDNLKLGETITVKNRGTGILKVLNKILRCSSYNIYMFLCYVFLKVLSKLSNENEFKCRLYCSDRCYIKGIISTNSFREARSISTVDKRLISIEEMTLTRRGEAKVSCWIIKATQNGSSICAPYPQAVSVNKILFREMLKRKWATDMEADFSEISFKDTVISSDQYKQLFVDEKKAETEKQEHEQEQTNSTDDQLTLIQSQNYSPLPRKKARTMNRVKVNKLSWISLE